jgi:hypothetical protein
MEAESTVAICSSIVEVTVHNKWRGVADLSTSNLFRMR